MFLTPTDKHWVVDIETDGLKPTRVWVLCAKNAVTGEKRTCVSYDEIKQFFADTPDAIYVGHNFLAFDAAVLNRLVGTRIPARRVVDTFLLSSIYSPALAGGHSLDSWGVRLGIAKPVHEDWEQYSEEMLHRCQQDVEINWQLFRRLSKRMRGIGFTEQGIELEHKAWLVILKQKKNGFYFDYKAAHLLFVELREKAKELESKIHERFPPELKLLHTYAKATKADGSFTKNYERHLEEYAKLEVDADGSYRAYGYVDFNLGSPPQRIAKLQELGWVPEEFTPPSKSFPEGQPKATEKGELVPSLARFAEESGVEEVKLIAQWMAVNGRASAINNWMNVYDEETHCIHGNLWLAQTLRYRHSDPNTANIPAVRVGKDEQPLRGAAGYWTYEARDLWQTRDPRTRRLVGVDAKGIQLRILAHYLNNASFTAAILSEDPHEANKKSLGLATRALTKTITYATLMGAGDKKIMTEAKVDLAEARAAKKKFFDQIPELKDLIRRLKREVQSTGRITLCDGTRILVPSPHMVIPYLLQGDESRIMKQAAVFVDEQIRKEKIDVLKCGDIHDEWQNDVAQCDIESFIGVCQGGFERTGLHFNYNLPIECDAKIGLTWAETH